MKSKHAATLVEVGVVLAIVATLAGLCVIFVFLTGCSTLNSAQYREAITHLQQTETRADARRAKYIAIHELGARTEEDILDGAIRIGMTKEQVVASVGYPRDSNKSVNAWGKYEQWIYGYITKTYLYFRNDKLTSWQD